MTDALLLVGDSQTDQNLYYKTNFLAEGFVYLEMEGQRTIVASSMERGRAAKESSVPTIRTFDDYGYQQAMGELKDRNRSFATILARAVQDIGADRVVVGPRFPLLYGESLRGDGLDVTVEPELLVLQRRQKSEDEIAAIEEAQRAGEAAAARAVEILRQCEERGGVLQYEAIPLTSERLRREMEVTMVRDDMDVSRSPTVAGGPGAAAPHWAGYGPLRANEAIVMDIVPRSKKTRYYADMTRTVVRGQPSDQLQAMYDAVLLGQKAALSEIRAGANGRDVHRVVQEVFREAGFDRAEGGPRYIHSTGHGVGLDIHEPPGLSTLDVELLENEVITVEPGLYDPAIGAVRVEDLVVVTQAGYRNLTHFPKDFVLS